MSRAAVPAASRTLAVAPTRSPINAGTLRRALPRAPFLGHFAPQRPKPGLRGACRGTLRAMGATAAPPRGGSQTAVAPPPKEAHGFELVSDEYVREYDSQVLTYKHKKTGAEVLSLVNDDENKTFSVVFRTPVSNSFGIPHILEHSVLCGSRKYPVKEPFVELLKGSLFTFLNAMTAPDRTYYPVASCNLQDYYNLMDIYLDAVYFPKCTKDPLVFQQEGWHHELEKEGEPLTYKGVVFNEMKGVYSSPDQTHGRRAMQVLFPDNNYQHDSGGDPQVIPNLTYKEFQDFHAAYYHPSNSRIWFSGDDPPVERLRILDEYLSKFERREVDSSVTTQPLMTAPKRIVEKFAAGEKEQKAFVSMNWVLSDTLFDTETQIAFRVLDYLMLGNPAAPLYKSLMDSGLGEALIGHGLDTEMRQPFFSVGLKGVDPADGEKVEKVVNDELLRLSKEGFSESAVQAALNTIEFSLRENNTGSFPRGLALMFAAVNAWIYDRNPIENIKWQEDLAEFKQRLASGEDVFGPLITKYLIENSHKVILEMQPDARLADEIAEVELERLKKEQEGMSNEQIASTISSTEELKHHQLTPDPPEALKSIPTLKLEDIPKEIKLIPTDERQEKSSTILTHDLFTNDILYLEAVLDMRSIPERLLPMVSLYCECVTQMGTEDYSFIELTEQIDGKTGGITVYPFVSDVRGQDEPVAKIMIKAKTTKDKVGDLMDLLQNVLLKGKLDDQKRFKQMVLENKAGLESGLVGSGHRFANMRLAAQRSVAGWVSEVTGGLSYLEYVRELAVRVDSDWLGVQADLEAIRSSLLTRNGAIINMTADEGTLKATQPYVTDFLDALPSDAKEKADWSSMLPRVNEAIVVPTQVNYVAKSINLFKDAGYKLNGSSFVVEKNLSRSYLWDRVRVVGGAYGAAGNFDDHSGNFTFWSYRDPNLLETLENYDNSVDFLKNLDLDNTALAQAIIGAIGDLDSYQLPDAKGHTALMRRLLNVTDAERQERRDQVLGTQVKDFQEYAQYLESVKGPEARVVAVTSADAAKEVLDKMPGFWQVTNAL